MIVLDTNVISEIMRPGPARDATVYRWLRAIDPDDVMTTAISVAEIAVGIESLPEGKRRNDMEAGAMRVFNDLFAGRILPFDTEAARHYPTLVGARRRAGLHHDHVFDLQIAAIAGARRLALATRNIGDFAALEIEVVNPWEQPAP